MHGRTGNLTVILLSFYSILETSRPTIVDFYGITPPFTFFFTFVIIYTLACVHTVKSLELYIIGESVHANVFNHYHRIKKALETYKVVQS